jgi:hypothetical protein
MGLSTSKTIVPEHCAIAILYSVKRLARAQRLDGPQQLAVLVQMPDHHLHDRFRGLA